MQPEQSKLTRLPSLSELEKRADEALSTTDETNTSLPRITEIICPILERYMAEEGRRGTARVHVTKNGVVCEKYMINKVVGGRSFNGCQLRYKYRGRFEGTGEVSELEFDDCPYKGLAQEK